MTTLYQRIVEAGIPYDNHESDLYVPDTPQVRAIIEECRHHTQHVFASFVHQVAPHKGELWLDIPFAYDPWWNERSKQVLVTN